MVVDMMLKAVLPAALVAAVLMAAVTFLAGVKLAPLGAALGVAGGFFAGTWLRGALPLAPGDSAWNGLPWAALAALAGGLVVRLPRLPPPAGWLLRAATAAGAAWWSVPAELWKETPWLPAAFAVTILIEWVLLEFLATRPPGAEVPWALALTALVAAAVLVHAGSARLMDIATVLAAALFGIGAAAWWQRADGGGAVPGAVIILPGVLLMGQQETFGDVPWPAFAAAAAAPLVLALPLLPQPLLRLALILVPLAVAVVLAAQAGPLEFE
jgi:hypothetical protein